MIGLKHLSTSEENEIAKNLSTNRAKVFLESRSYIRESLGNLFNINPLNFPIKAFPGRIPKIPYNMGNISISHSHDAFVIAWHKEKIGIDIERSDRKFNYKAIAKKYLLKKKGSIEITKKNVLNEWNAIEAAIKWDQGKLSKDLKEWEFIKKKERILHKNKKIDLNLKQFDFYEWTISIAFQDKDFHNKRIIICNNSLN